MCDARDEGRFIRLAELALKPSRCERTCIYAIFLRSPLVYSTASDVPVCSLLEATQLTVETRANGNRPIGSALQTRWSFVITSHKDARFVSLIFEPILLRTNGKIMNFNTNISTVGITNQQRHAISFNFVFVAAIV